MPKHAKAAHQKGIGINLIGTPDELVKLIIPGKEERQWAIEQITNEGPAHKQVYSALLLKRLLKLIKTVELSTGTEFTVQEGEEIISTKHDEEITIPIALPLKALKNKSYLGLVKETLSRAPEHEQAAFSLMLQAIEWSIEALKEKQK